MHPSSDRLDLYLAGRLSEEDERWVEEHYLECPECLGHLSRVADVMAALRAMPTFVPNLLSISSPSVTTAAQSNGAGRSRKAAPETPRFPSRGLLRSAALILIGVGMGILCVTPAPQQESPPMLPVVHVNPPVLASFSEPRSFDNPASRIPKATQTRQAKAVYAKGPRRVFRPPISLNHRVTEIIVLEIPRDPDLLPRPDRMSDAWTPPTLPPFKTRPGWLQRVKASLRKGFEPSWQ